MRKFMMIILLFPLNILAQDGEVQTPKGGKVLDFNADVIEGEVKRPQLFFELGGDVKDLDSILYIREDFNDFHAVDMKKRLRYVK